MINTSIRHCTKKKEEFGNAPTLRANIVREFRPFTWPEQQSTNCAFPDVAATKYYT